MAAKRKTVTITFEDGSTEVIQDPEDDVYYLEDTIRWIRNGVDHIAEDIVSITITKEDFVNKD